MSRITASRGRRVYRRDARGRFAKTGTTADSEADATDVKTSNRVAKAVGITAISVTGTVAVGTAAGTAIASRYRRDTAAVTAAYRSALEASEMDRRVEKLIEKHRKRQKIAAARAR
ncbi:hypothetical protein [Mycolicibacterium iranicum]|uniref:hypothetical protein n=1 Tax=Mycolicibacterium iranicum TaxID=912594 RepID=UPI0004639BE7|nr:hypothetical protein [Mycolicibacterium iranicum]